MACDHCHMPDQKSPVGAVGSGRPLLLEVCRLLEFLLEVATLDSYKEAPCEYLPTLLHDVSQALVVSCERLSMPQLLAALKLCSRILQKVSKLTNLFAFKRFGPGCELIILPDPPSSFVCRYVAAQLDASIRHNNFWKDFRDYLFLLFMFFRKI